MHSLKKSIMLIMKAALPVVASVIFLYTVKTYYFSLTGFFSKGFILFAVLYGVLDLLFLIMYGGTRIDSERPRNLMLSSALSLLFSNIIVYVILSLLALKLVYPVPLIISMIVQILVSCLICRLLVGTVRRLYPPTSTAAVISVSDNDTDAVEKIRKFDYRHRINAVFSASDLDESLSVLKDYSSVVIGDLPYNIRAKLLSYCYTEGKDIVLIPRIDDIMLNNSVQYIVNDRLLYVDKYTGFSTEAAFIKRLFDICFSLLAIIITSPVMAVVAVLIHSYDKGPALFRQTRLTKDGRAFTIVKFRSMIENAEKKGGTYLVLDGDDRITPIGKVIRALRIDELPQLFNILKGDMSFVGPRPERPELYDIYCKDNPEFRHRLKVKAGLTGYAQVYGKYNTTAADKVKLDLLYIEKASLLQDMQILLYTLKIIFIKESSEGLTDTDKAAKK